MEYMPGFYFSYSHFYVFPNLHRNHIPYRFHLLLVKILLMYLPAQAKGKALETPESNAIIGEWIRHKLGVPDGTYITKQMLDQYGKTKVLFKKYEDGIYTLEY